MSDECIVKNRKEEILANWEKIRERSPAASAKSRSSLRDHLPDLIDLLCQVLTTRIQTLPKQESKIHGRQRFAFRDYTLAEVLKEYTQLKEVIFDILERHDPNYMKDFRLIDHFFSAASTIAAVEFSFLREEELKLVTRDLESKNSDLERFAAIAAHDLRSPASTIIGYADLAIEEGVIADSSEENPVCVIRKMSVRMIHLIDQLLEYTKIGKSEIAKKKFSLDSVLKDVQTNLAQVIKDSNANIEVGSLAEIDGDPILIGQLFQNLIANSIKFRSPGRPLKIQIRCVQDNELLEVFVSDNGKGFDPKIAGDIFEPFQKGHRDPAIEGSGLGLATVRRILELHGGKVEVSAQPGEGAEFKLEFPQPYRPELTRL